MKNSFNKLIATSIFIVIIIFNLLFIFSPKNNYLYKEKRVIEKMPVLSIKSIITGAYFKNMENYLSDNISFRDGLVYLKTKSEIILGKDQINNIYLAKDNYLISDYTKPKNTDKIINLLNEFNSKINYINTNLMIVPSSITINNSLLPKNSPNYNESLVIKRIYKAIKFNTVDITNELINHNKDYNMFYKTDDNWTMYASYYAYKKYSEVNNIEPISLNSFNIEKVDTNFKGNLYSKTGTYNYKGENKYIFYMDNLNYEMRYLNSNKIIKKLNVETIKEPIVITNNSLVDNKQLIVISDKLGDSLIPFLINHYKVIHVINPIYYNKEISNYILENKSITDCLILYNVNTIDFNEGIIKIK